MKPGDDRRQAAERRGRRAEWIAALYLTLKGYRVTAMRERTPVGEIDLVARKGNLVVFVEVKARESASGGADAVTVAAQRRIRAAGDLHIGRLNRSEDLSWRFDIVVVPRFGWPIHLENAF